MNGTRQVVQGADGVEIGLLSAGAGSPLLLVHGGVGQIERWHPMWDQLSVHWQVTAMDRRGRASSGDGTGYSIDSEFQDIVAVAEALSEDAGRLVDVFAHSYGATCTLGAANRGASFQRVVLYEPPARQTCSLEFVDRISTYVHDGRVGKAMVTFLMETIGMTSEEVNELRRTPPTYDILSVLSATLPREALALLGVELPKLASSVTCPSLFLLGERSPKWANEITRETALVLPNSQISTLPGLGHQAIDEAPDTIVSELLRFLCPEDVD